MKTKTIITVVLPVTIAIILISLVTPRVLRAYRNRPDPGRGDHRTYHDCQFIRDEIIPAAKLKFAAEKGLVDGAPVTCEDLEKYVAEDENYKNMHEGGTVRDSLTTCPSGGKYTLNPIGSNAVCSDPYHSWYNCMWKTQR